MEFGLAPRLVLDLVLYYRQLRPLTDPMVSEVSRSEAQALSLTYGPFTRRDWTGRSRADCVSHGPVACVEGKSCGKRDRILSRQADSAISSNA